MLTGFRREQQQFNISDDKRTINFTIVDTQLPYPLPPGVSHCSCKHKIENDPGSFVNWRGNISATITMPAPSLGKGKGETWEKFMLLVGSVPLLASAFEQIGRQDWSHLGALAWGAFVYSLFFSLVFTNIMWFTAIDRVGAVRARRPRGCAWR